jgi:RNA polymerase sigma-70 factor (ECF subfamily)
VDRFAFTLLYERYVHKVHRYCLVRLGSREAAEDATSEIFLKLLRDLPHYRGGLFVSWLFSIAQHTVVDLQRRQRRDQPAGRPQVDHADADEGVADPAPLPEEYAIAGSDMDTLRALLPSLPADQRTFIELQLADLSTQEIADALGRSPNAVRILRFRAYRHLRPLLAPAGAGESRGGSA